MTYIADQIRKGIGGKEAVHVLVYGREGVGKSSFAMKTLYEIVQDWDEVLKLTKFDLKEIVQTLTERKAQGKQTAGIIADDAGVHLHGSRYTLSQEDRYLMILFEGLADTIRTVAASVIYTTPSPRKVTKNIRERPGAFRVKIVKRSNRTTRRADIWRVWWSDRENRARTIKVAETQFNCRLPDWVYEKYRIMREAYDTLIRTRILKILADGSEKDREQYGDLRKRVEELPVAKK